MKILIHQNTHFLLYYNIIVEGKSELNNAVRLEANVAKS